MRRLVLVRHGESVWNAEHRVQGQSCAGLSALGHAQARTLAGALAAAHPVARVVTSDLQRTRETAAPLTAALGATVSEEPRLRERAFGDWEGRRRDEIVAHDPARWQRWLDGDDVVAEVGGEPAVDLAARVLATLQELLATTPDDGVTVAVTHGGPIWHGTHALLALPHGSLGGVDNASVTALLLRDGRIVLDRWNEVAHLPVEQRSGWRPVASAPWSESAPDTTTVDPADVATAVADGPPG